MPRFLTNELPDVSVSPGMARLMYQPSHIARVNSKTATLTARYYRLIIYLLTATVILFSLFPYRLHPFGWAVILLALASHSFYTLIRWRLSILNPEKFYKPRTQILRAQIAIAGITLLLVYSSAIGAYDRQLSLLYLLPILIVSEHAGNRTSILIFAEITALLFAGFMSGVRLSNDGPESILILRNNVTLLLTNLLWLGLLTFLCRYLQSNIQGRHRAYTQLIKLLDIINEQVLRWNDPLDQRKALINLFARDLNASGNLWMQQVTNDEFVDLDGRHSDWCVRSVIQSEQPALILRGKPDHFHSTFQVYEDRCLPLDAQARLLLPVLYPPKQPRVVAVLDFAFKESPSDLAWFDISRAHFDSLVECSRAVLISSIRQRRGQLIREISHNLYQSLDSRAIVDMAVADIVDKLGLDFATISLIDIDQQTIQMVAAKNAGWQQPSTHPLNENDIQSWVVRQRAKFHNDGTYDPRFDLKIYTEFDHCNCTRLWLPLYDPSSRFGNHRTFGTIEVGYWHQRRSKIPRQIEIVLISYARALGTALANALQYEQKVSLASGLTDLNEFGVAMHVTSLAHDVDELAHSIGKHAEEQFGADLVLLYLVQPDCQTLQNVYASESITLLNHAFILDLEANSMRPNHTRTRAFFAPNGRRAIALIQATGYLDNYLSQIHFDPERMASFALLPLIGHERTNLGWLCLGFAHRHQFEPIETEIMELFVRWAALEVERIHKSERMQAVALDQERVSFANKTHDSISQTLFALGFQASAAMRCLNQNNADEGLMRLEDVSLLAAKARTDLKNLIFELKNPPPPVADFKQEMMDHIERMSRVFTSPITFEPEETSVTVPNHIQFYLLRIAREALDNALRYAQGAAITVSYGFVDAGVLQVIVKDEGPGFDVQQARRERSNGLECMEFFANAIDAEINIQSSLNQGTRVTVRLSNLD